MASELIDKVQNLFDKLEARRSVLSTCTDLYQTLTSHFSSLEQSIASESQTLDSKLQTLDSDYHKSLEQLKAREESIPNLLCSISSRIETQKQAAITEYSKPLSSSETPTLELAEELKSLCRIMDQSKLLKVIMAKRKDITTLKSEIGSALNECVDSPRLVLDCVKEFMQLKANVKSGQPDRRWACGIVVGGMFPFEEMKEKDTKIAFSRAILERADAMAKEWRDKATERAAAGVNNVGGEGKYGMGPAEASMFLHFVTGFGLKEKFEFEFLKGLVMEFPSRRDMSKLAGPLFGEKVAGIIDDLVETGKEVDAVYFASDIGLTDKVQPVTLLKSYLSKSEKNAKDILKKGNNNPKAADEANIFERNALKLIIKCVEENNLEAKFSLHNVNRRLSVLDRHKNEKKKGSAGGSKPTSNKRGHSKSSVPPRPAKVPRFSGPYPPFGQRKAMSPARPNPVSRYPGAYSYPSQNVYDAGLITASPYGSSYSAPHLPASAQASQLPYGIPGESVGGPGGQLGGSYGGHSYSSYDYGGTSLNAYQPPSYT